MKKIILIGAIALCGAMNAQTKFGVKAGYALSSVNTKVDGIDEEDMPHIFERFYKGKGGKNGIGLAIVKTVADLHGGSVSADCSHGTTFTLTF